MLKLRSHRSQKLLRQWVAITSGILVCAAMTVSCAPKQQTGTKLHDPHSVIPDTPLHPDRVGHRVAVPVELKDTGEAHWPSEVRLKDVSIQEIRQVGERVQVALDYTFRNLETNVVLEGELKRNGETIYSHLYQKTPVRPKLLVGQIFCTSQLSCVYPKVEIFYRQPNGTLETVQVHSNSAQTLGDLEAGADLGAIEPLPDLQALEESAHEGHFEFLEENKPGRFTAPQIEDELTLKAIAEIETPTEALLRALNQDDVEKPEVASTQTETQEEEAKSEEEVENKSDASPPRIDLDVISGEVRRAQRRPESTEFVQAYEEWLRNERLPVIDSKDFRSRGSLLGGGYLVPNDPQESCVRWRRPSDEHQLWVSSLTYFFLHYVGSFYCEQTENSLLIVNAGSFHGGGPFTGANTHQNGLDIDMRYPRNTGAAPSGSVIRNGAMISDNGIRALTWKVIKEMHRTNAVDLIVIHPAVIKAIRSEAEKTGEIAQFRELESHLLGRNDHHDHIHVQLKCAPMNHQCRNRRIGE